VLAEIITNGLKTLPLAMWALFVDCTTMEELGEVSRAMIAVGGYLAFCALIVFVLMSALTVMNMLIAGCQKVI